MANLKMNGMISHAFAAVMTATVVLFPTPKDLWETITERPLAPDQARVINAGIDRSFPANLKEQNPSIGKVIESLDYCASNLSSPLPVHLSECREVLTLAAHRLPNNGDRVLEAEVMQRLELASALYCRQAWATSQQLNNPFDAGICQSNFVVLAQERRSR